MKSPLIAFVNALVTFSAFQIRDTGGDWQGKFRPGDSSAGSQNGTAHRHQDHQVRGNGAVASSRDDDSLPSAMI